MSKKKKFEKKSPLKMNSMVQTIFSCKWSLTAYDLINKGINRPGEMVRNVEGLSTKVLNDCLRKSMEFGILEKTVYQELPPRVEYKITEFGEKFLKIIAEIEKLDQEISSSSD